MSRDINENFREYVMSLTRNKMSYFPCDSGRSFDSTHRVSVKSYENETLVKNLQKGFSYPLVKENPS